MAGTATAARWPGFTLVVAVIVSSTIGASCGDSGGSGSGAQSSSEPAASQPSSSSTDTGRMSDGEFDELKTAMQNLADEEQAFGSQISSKCRVLLTALALADASDCIHDAWSGTYDKGLFVYGTIDDLKADVGDGCKATLLKYQKALDRFVSAQDNAANAGENLQLGRFKALARLSTRLAKPFRRLQIRVLAECAPT